MLTVRCFKYEDDEDENQNLITVYLILVEDMNRNIKYTVHKRYSDFLELYLILRPRSIDIETFRFPNKSLFNNHSR